MADPRTGARNMQGVSRTSCSARKRGRDHTLREWWPCVEEKQEPTKELPVAQAGTICATD